MRVRAVLLMGLWPLCCSAPAVQRPAPSFAAIESRPATDEFTPDERVRLASGQPVHRERYLTHGDQRYLGTVSYQIVHARPETILGAVEDIRALPQILPNTKRATLIDSSQAGSRVELVQGNRWFSATFAVVLAKEQGGGVRFWLDSSRPHDIDDAWGYFRAERIDDQRSLMTVGLAVDIGSGLFRFLFTDVIQRRILSTPDLVRKYAERLESQKLSLWVPQTDHGKSAAD